MLTTFLTDAEVRSHPTNATHKHLVEEIYEATGKRWIVLTRDAPQPAKWQRWFKKPNPPRYELCIYIGGIAPYQTITAAMTQREVTAYLLGYATAMTPKHKEVEL